MYITFTDGTGAAQLDNGLRAIAGGVASRAANWVPDTKVVGAVETGLGTGQRFMFPFRTDYLASFDVPELPNSMLSIALRLKAWLEAGNTCHVYTEDSGARDYATCGLAEGASVTLKCTDKVQFLWTLSLTIVNLAGSPTAMLCLYD